MSNSTGALHSLVNVSQHYIAGLIQNQSFQIPNHNPILPPPLRFTASSKGLCSALKDLGCSDSTISILTTLFDESAQGIQSSLSLSYLDACESVSKSTADPVIIHDSFLAIASNFQLHFQQALDSFISTIVKETMMAKAKLLTAPATPLACGKFTAKNLNILFTAYENKNKLSTADKVALAFATGLNSKQIAVWFANQRSRKTNPKKSARGLQQKKYQRDNVDLSAYVSSALKCEPIPADPIYAPATLSPPASTFIPFIPATESSAFLSSTSATRGISPMSMVGSEYSFHEDMEEIMDHLPPNLAQLHYFSSPSPARPPIQPENYYPSHRSEASHTSQHQEVVYEEIERGSTGSTGLYNDLLASTGHGIGGMGMVDIRGGLTLNMREVAMDY